MSRNLCLICISNYLYIIILIVLKVKRVLKVRLDHQVLQVSPGYLVQEDLMVNQVIRVAQVNLELLVRLVLPGRLGLLETEVLKDHWVQLVRQAHQGLRVLQVYVEIPVQQGLWVHLDLLGQKVHQEIRVDLDLKVQLEQPDRQASREILVRLVHLGTLAVLVQVDPQVQWVTEVTRVLQAHQEHQVGNLFFYAFGMKITFPNVVSNTMIVRNAVSV